MKSTEKGSREGRQERFDAVLRGVQSGMGSGVIAALRDAQGALQKILETQVEIPAGVSHEDWSVIKHQIWGRFHDACRQLEQPILYPMEQ